MDRYFGPNNTTGNSFVFLAFFFGTYNLDGNQKMAQIGYFLLPPGKVNPQYISTWVR